MGQDMVSMKQMRHTKILRGKASKGVTDIIISFAKKYSILRIFKCYVINDEMKKKQHKQSVSFYSMCITSALATFRNVGFYVNWRNSRRLY